MSVLVTGASGFVGQHLLRLLTELRSGLIVAGGLHPLPSGDAARGVEWVEFDVTSVESIGAVLERYKPTRVYHLAGQASVGGSFQDPAGTWDVNALGVVRLLDGLRRAGCEGARVLLISSAEAYGAVPREAQPIAESAPLRPISPYGASKAAAEIAGLQAAAAGVVEVVIARSFNHAGPGQDARFVLPSMARQLRSMDASAGEPVLRVGNLDVWRDFLDVRDVVRAYVCLMDEGESGLVYNVCSGQLRSLQEIVERLVEISGTGARIEVDAERFRPVDIPALVGDPARLIALGWHPRVSLEQMLRDLLDASEQPAAANG